MHSLKTQAFPDLTANAPINSIPQAGQVSHSSEVSLPIAVTNPALMCEEPEVMQVRSHPEISLLVLSGGCQGRWAGQVLLTHKDNRNHYLRAQIIALLAGLPILSHKIPSCAFQNLKIHLQKKKKKKEKRVFGSSPIVTSVYRLTPTNGVNPS